MFRAETAIMKYMRCKILVRVYIHMHSERSYWIQIHLRNKKTKYKVGKFILHAYTPPYTLTSNV